MQLPADAAPSPTPERSPAVAPVLPRALSTPLTGSSSSSSSRGTLVAGEAVNEEDWEYEDDDLDIKANFLAKQLCSGAMPQATVQSVMHRSSTTGGPFQRFVGCARF